ncbi:MAG: hypothetical protein D6683_11215, partial [Actinomyces sp.]
MTDPHADDTRPSSGPGDADPLATDPALVATAERLRRAIAARGRQVDRHLATGAAPRPTSGRARRGVAVVARAALVVAAAGAVAAGVWLVGRDATTDTASPVDAGPAPTSTAARDTGG